MKVFFKRSGPADHGMKKNVMGTASAAFADADLKEELKTSIHLAYFLFGRLDRKVISAMEITFNMNAAHRQNVRRFIGQVDNLKSPLKDIVRPFRNASHNTRYRIFGDFCEIISSNPDSDAAFIRRIASIGRALNLSEDEIFRCIKQTRIAV